MAYKIHNVHTGDTILAQTTLDQDMQIAANEARIEKLEKGVSENRVYTLDGTLLQTGTSVIEAVGIPTYVDDVASYSNYRIVDTGWYVFARITAPGDIAVSDTTVVAGANAIINPGVNYIDVAVRFEVAAQAQAVTVAWDANTTETFVFKADDLAIRNLDYRTTFYVYDISPFITWQYKPTTDTVFTANKKYYVKDENDELTSADVETVAYILTADETFVANKVYYIKDGDTYVAATVTVGEAVTADTYYEQTTVPVPAYYKQVGSYVLTTDTTFQEGTTYYAKDGEEYSAAEVTVGEAVPANTYYVPGLVWTQAEDGVFNDNVAYYTKNGAEYVAAEVTVGDPCPAYYNHSKLTFSGMVRNVTYILNESIDCPQEYILPEIEDDTHGCWYEIRLRHEGSFSSTLVVPEGVKVATEHTQAETAGLNMVDLHYTNIDGVKLWRFLNTHSTIPA